MSDREFDVVVIGGGTSGCVLAARLSEDPHRQVALVESGSDYSRSQEPATVLDTFPTSMTDSRFLWPDLKVSQREFDGHPEPPSGYTQPRALGGGSMVMGMHALRGLPSDFDEWRDSGASGWGWDDLWPYFRKMERDLENSGPDYGDCGPIPMWRHDPDKWAPFARAVAAALESKGLRQGRDINNERGDGVFPMPYNANPSHRVTIPSAYLTPEVRKRQNLSIITDTFARRLVFDGRRASAIEIERHGQKSLLRAKEFVVSCGAIQSPALLLRSGVGPAAHLRDRGCDIVHDLPGVGSHLLNHPMMRLAARLKRGQRHPKTTRPHGNSVVRYSSGLAGCHPSDMCILVLGKSSWHSVGATIAALAVSVYKSYSEGTVRLSRSPNETMPVVEFRHLSDERDLERMTDAFVFSTGILADPRVSALITEPFIPNSSPWINRLATPTWRSAALSRLANSAMDALPPVEKHLMRLVGVSVADKVARDEIKQFVFETTVGMYHPSGTCRMGASESPTTVVAPDCRVLGLANVSVADASIMPSIPRANTFLSSVVIAERAAAIMHANHQAHRAPHS